MSDEGSSQHCGDDDDDDDFLPLLFIIPGLFHYICCLLYFFPPEHLRMTISDVVPGIWNFFVLKTRVTTPPFISAKKTYLLYVSEIV